MKLAKLFIGAVREYYKERGFIPLHAPQFLGNEKAYLCDVIDSTYVSSVGPFVDKFENALSDFTGSRHAIATSNGTSALHTALLVSGVKRGDYVITQALTFVATANAITYAGAEPIFVDVDQSSLSLCPLALENFLTEHAEHLAGENITQLKVDGRRIKAVVPMHTFGHPADLDSLLMVCERWGILLIEDAAESLGSTYKKLHTGRSGICSAVSFNGNKIITTGGGGAVLTCNKTIARAAKHITTTAKVPHPFDFDHDEIGYNYRMPNINAALGCAQLESLSYYIDRKRALATFYDDFFSDLTPEFVKEPAYAKSNYWLNAIILDDLHAQQEFLKYTNDDGVMTRPVWKPMHMLKIFAACKHGDLTITNYLSKRVVNLPSTPLTRTEVGQ